MAQRRVGIELREKFQGMEFRDFCELLAKVIEYEELLKEESYQRKKFYGNLLSRGESRGSSDRSIYYRDIHLSSVGRKGT